MKTTAGQIVAFDCLVEGDDINATYELEDERFVASGIFARFVKRDDGVYCMRLKSSRAGLRATTLLSTQRITAVTRMNRAR